jgi:hypothetical protein
MILRVQVGSGVHGTSISGQDNRDEMGLCLEPPRLALAGNPTVLLVLFVPDEEVVFRDEAGAELVSNAQRFVSRLAAGRFLGYPGASRCPCPSRTVSTCARSAAASGRWPRSPQLPELLDPQSEPDAPVAADRDPAEIVPEHQAFLAQQPGRQAR